MKKRNSFEQARFAALLISDMLATLTAWFASYYLRFFVLPGAQRDSLLLFSLLSIVACLMTFFFQQVNRLYRTDVNRTWVKESTKLFFTAVEVFLGFVTFYYYFFPEKISRLALALFLAFHYFFLVINRTIVSNHFSDAFAKGRYVRKVLLVGYGEKMDQYSKAVTSKEDTGLTIVGRYYYNPDDNGKFPKISASCLEEAANKVDADIVVISFPISEIKTERRLTEEGMDLLEPKVVLLPYLPESYAGTYISDFHYIPTLTINSTETSFMQRMTKRVFDIFSCSIGVLISSPIMLIIAIIVKLTSKGPILFKQERVTRDGKVFKMYKFRSMRIDMPEANGPHWTEENDPRITPIGRFIRKTSLDELPQFFNVIGGSMSLIGPRPERPELETGFKKTIPGYNMRHRMKAGISGWAQVNGLRGNTSLYKRIDFDLYYIRHWSIWFDFRIVFLTFFKGFINKNAY